MFVRTERLTLRPGWSEDSPALAQAIGHWEVVSKLTRAPWPYALGDAEAFLEAQRFAERPALLIHAHAEGAAQLIGAIGLARDEQGDWELGYWLTPPAWGRGYATEAARAMVAAARESLRLKRLVSGHFIDNPASARVLRKLGFRPTGRVVPRASRALGHDAPCATFELLLTAEAAGDDPRSRMAA